MNDQEIEKILMTMWTKLDTLNDRTKSHTIDIKNLEKEIKGLKAQK